MTLHRFFAIAATLLLLAFAPAHADSFRPPSVPLISVDPYFSVWSPANKLTDVNTQHWTHHDQPLVSLIRIDGATYRLMGDDPASMPAFPQTSVRVMPTRSIYDFDDSHVHVTLTFMTPRLASDLDIFARPVTYITWSVASVDGAVHSVSIYDSASSLLTVDQPGSSVLWSREVAGTLTALKAGSLGQTTFSPAGDDTRINWGYAYLAAPTSHTTSAIGGDSELIDAFATTGYLPKSDDTRQPRAANYDQPVLAFEFNLGSVTATPVVRHVIAAYDEVYSIKWFGYKLRPYWRRNGATPETLLETAERDYPSLKTRCQDFDDALVADATAVGGSKYAQIVALAHRQTFAACGLVADPIGKPLLLTKENTSNGDIATVDVVFPMSPQMLFLSPTLAKACVVPALAYAASPHWKFPNAPHDLGTYPIAGGRDNGGEGMPVEESGNILIICDAIAQEEGNAAFAVAYWKELTQWAQFLQQYGIDPGNQLCTDDFMGPLAHNSNLSVKAIIALAAYGDLCRMRGDDVVAQKYADIAKADAKHWIDTNDTGDHSLLAFDKGADTWSQKYNLIWDKVLGLNVFPPDVATKEIAKYEAELEPYGVPLDSRTKLTETPWSVWCASLASKPQDFNAIITPLYNYLDQTSTRDPLSDSYSSDNASSGGMHARPVVGAVFVKMLTDRAMWKKWSSQDTSNIAGWARVPSPPTIVEVVPSSQYSPQIWKYVTKTPADDWTMPSYDDSSWAHGPGGFGSIGTPNAVIGTHWTDTPGDIYLRRTVTIPAGNHHSLQFWVYHDEDVEIYVDGVLAAQESGFNNAYEVLEPTAEGEKLLVPGKTITLAVHCHQTDGGQGVDVGIVDVKAELPNQR